MKTPSALMARRLATYGRRFDAERFRAARIRAGLTVERLQDIIYPGAGKRYSIEGLEDGSKVPSPQMLMRFCQLLKCQMDDIAPKIR
ncbi:helix-turn-helix transcriptional regulator [Mesorhizobium sp. M1B.F.Ca.ET.045.04.1.1]|uniref:helix-turn-helix transcriptional regulator n=1 Tax=Mesorhizobium sp. M1B.F.Ca.ET.045.04.1.1 TaxID=2493673 RepID=UPI000F75882A|nr:helix-turn-helix transcriptional regulator [Mesorhizobium sp. M1B.F.Ca.ET.045.04.1.1]AZO29798.1 XRE family transcriptional regulator [Mesorhizobium sp. M1B.F.Ca.ET.045.04.1.1]